MSYFEKDAIMSGIGISRIGRRTGIPGLELTMEAVRAAIEDAGLVAADIDGIATLGDTPAEDVNAATGNRGGRLRIRIRHRRPAEPGDVGVPCGRRATRPACGRVPDDTNARRHRPGEAARECARSAACADVRDARRAQARPAVGAMDDVNDLVAAHAYSAANWLALNCRRHMELYGTTKEQLGWVALNGRRNAALNPLAVYRDPMTMADYLGARPVSTPFGLLDCDVPIDGSIAVVVSSAEYARDCPHRAVAVEAIGGSDGAGGWFHRDDYPKMAMSDAAAQMWSRTELKPADLDVAELYDGFTFLTIAWLEALGICGDGEAGPFVEGGVRIARDGELPLNTYGGQLSAGRMHGYWALHEGCLQLRGEAGERQVSQRPRSPWFPWAVARRRMHVADMLR